VNVNAKIVRIGNSRGVRIPRPLLDEAGLDGDVRLSVTEAGILIEPLSGLREGWVEAATLLRGQGDAGLLDVPLPTDWDEAEWVWE
jgi:antitoxin MazE